MINKLEEPILRNRHFCTLNARNIYVLNYSKAGTFCQLESKIHVFCYKTRELIVELYVLSIRKLGGLMFIYFKIIQLIGELYICLLGS